MPLAGFFQSLGAMFARPARPREYNFDPVHFPLFDARPSGTPCDQATPGKGPRLVLRGPAIAPSVCKRLEQLSLSTAEMPALAIDGDEVFQYFRRIHSALPQLFFHQREVVTNKIQIEHLLLTLAEKCDSVHGNGLTVRWFM